MKDCENETKRIVAIANTSMHLMILAQIRRKLFSMESCEFDIVLAAKMLKPIYDSHRAEKIFSHVYYYDQWSYGPKLSHFLSPRKALSEMLGDLDFHYDEIFFWNPDWLCYYFYRFNFAAWAGNRNSNCPKMHLFTDGIVLYIGKPAEENFHRYQSKTTSILNRINESKYHWKNIEEFDYDMYLFKNDLMIYEERDHEIIDIPRLNEADVIALQQLFGYQPEKVPDYSEKVIFLDLARDGFVSNDDILNIIKALRDRIGTDNLLVRAHPRVDKSIYEVLGIHLMDSSIMWEIYYLTEKLTDKTIIGLNSSGQIMPYIMAGTIANTVSLDRLLDSSYIYNEEMKVMFRRLQEEYDGVTFPATIEELCDVVADSMTGKDQ